MKLIKILMLFCIGALLTVSSAMGQANPSVGILPLNAGGEVAVGAVMDVKITINNTLSGSIPAAKLRPVISIPAIATILPNADQTGLPAGWVIVTNAAGQIRVCNASDVIGGNEQRDIIIKVQGTTIGGPSTCQVQMNYGGTTCGTTGPQPSGNLTVDDFATSSITVIAAPACALGVTATAGTILCNGGTTTLTATPSGENGTVEYSLNGGAFQTSNSFTVTAAGSPYTITAREVAAPTCTATSSPVTVSEPVAVSASGSVSTPIPTIGGTGSITVTATGGTGTITYSEAGGNTTGASSGVFTGLVAGTYTFTATDANGCTGTATVTINDPAPCVITGVTATPGTISCNGGTTSITAVAAPAGPVYEYSINGGAFQPGGTFSNLPAGSYTIVAREAGNTPCTANTVVTVTQPAALSASGAVSTPIAIPGGQGEITVTATGGTGAYSYVVTSGTTTNTTGATSGVFTGLLAGVYTFTVTDGNSCSVLTAPVNLANPGIATADPAVGQMYFTTTSGAAQSANTLLMDPAPDLYDINVPFYNLNQVNPVPNGTISLSVNLGRKLVLAPGFNLATAPLSTYFSWAQSNVNGDIILTGTQIATIPADFNDIAIFRVKGDSACRSNIVSNVEITNVLQTLQDNDLQNNSATLQYTIPVTLSQTQVNVTCNGAGNGIINIVASSGTTVTTTGPGGYSNTTGLPSGVTNFSLSGLAPGTYTITASASSVTPLANCSVVTTVTILEPTVLAIPGGSVSHTNIFCYGANDGTITVAATGGTQPYNYIIAGPTVNTTGALSGIFTGLAAGSYTVTVIDNNGCTVTTSAIIITQPAANLPDISLGSDVTGSLFLTPGVTQTIVYNIAEIAGNAAVGDTIRITKVNGFTINFNPTIFSTVVGGTTYALDNPRWKIDNSNPAFVSIILTDPNNVNNPGTINCNQLVRVAVTITRNTSNISTFTLSARLRKADGEVNLDNNLNSVIFAAE